MGVFGEMGEVRGGNETASKQRVKFRNGEAERNNASKQDVSLEMIW